MLGILKFLLMGVLAIAALGLGLGLLGIVLGLAVGLAVLAVKVGVVALIGYGVWRLVRGRHPEKQISAADRKWLES